jgi:hypothetical protein
MGRNACAGIFNFLKGVLLFQLLIFFFGGRKFWFVTTLLPVLLSNAALAFLAIAPPCLPATAFCFFCFCYLPGRQFCQRGKN